MCRYVLSPFLAAATLVQISGCRGDKPTSGTRTRKPATVTRTLLLHTPEAFSNLDVAEYRVLLEGPCCELDIPGDFRRNVDQHVKRSMVDSLPEVRFTYRPGNETTQWRVEVDLKLATHAAGSLEKWPCSVEITLSRQSEPDVVHILHWSRRVLYCTPEDILAELDKELGKLVGKWKSGRAG